VEDIRQLVRDMDARMNVLRVHLAQDGVDDYTKETALSVFSLAYDLLEKLDLTPIPLPKILGERKRILTKSLRARPADGLSRS
jgi:hypothetical protein